MLSSGGCKGRKNLHIELSVLGPTRVIVNGAEVHLTRVDRALLAALAYLPSGTSDEVVAEWAWDSALVARALSSAKYRLRRMIHPDILITSRHMCQLNRELVTLDIDVFATIVEESRSDPRAVPPLRTALEMVRGRPFDSARGALWAGVRAAWDERIATYSLELCRRSALAGQFDEAVPLARELCQRWPRREQTWLALIGLLRQQHRELDALRVVEEARSILASAGLPLPNSLVAQERTLLAVGPPTAAVAGSPMVHAGSLVGRVGEALTLTDALHRAQSHRFAVATLRGYTGFGKSSLLANLRDEAERTGCCVAATTCIGDATDAGRWQAGLARALGVSWDGAAAGGGIDRLVGAIEASPVPVVLMIDDADRLSGRDRDDVGRLLGCQPQGMLVALAGTPSPVIDRWSRLWLEHAIELAPMGDPAVAEWLTSAGRAELSVADVQWLTGGSPLALRVLLAVLAAHGPETIGLPPETEPAVLAARLSALSDGAARLARRLALADRPLSIGELLAVRPAASEPDESDERVDGAAMSRVHALLDELVAASIVRHTAIGFQLQHPQLAEVIASRLTTAQRMELDGAVATMSRPSADGAVMGLVAGQ